MATRSERKRIKRRAVLYFAGFDPRGASVYHALTSEQFAKHCEQNGFGAEIGKRKRVDNSCHQWVLASEDAQSNFQTDFRFLVWDDLVRQYWIRPDWKSVLRGSIEFSRLTNLGFLRDTYPIAWPFVLTIAGPFIQTVAFALIGLLAILSILAVIFGQVWFGLIGIVVSLFAGFIIPKVMKSFNAPWIGRVNAFVIASTQQPIFENWTNRQSMVDQLVSALDDENYEEVLLVSHSLGTQPGLLALADALEKSRETVENAVASGRLVFITLGQTVPMMSKITPAVTKALEVVGQSSVPWLDVSAPADPACYALVDSYRQQFGGEPRIHVQNARLFRGFSHETYRQAQADRFTMHFLYLMTPDAEDASERSKSFNFYALMTARDKLSNHLPSKPKDSQPYFLRKAES